MAFTKLENNKTIKFYVKSTDTKPTSLDIPADKLAQLFEVDTGNTYYWLDNTWVQSYYGGIKPQGTINITENGSYDVSQYANADVDTAGGFTTATLEVLASYTLEGEFACCIVHPDTGIEGVFALYSDPLPVHTYTVPLYKGKCIANFWTTAGVSLSGAIEDVGNNTYIITGDCTIAELK